MFAVGGDHPVLCALFVCAVNGKKTDSGKKSKQRTGRTEDDAKPRTYTSISTGVALGNSRVTAPRPPLCNGLRQKNG